jgi:transposase
MRALERSVVDAVYAAIEPLLPARTEHPLGNNRPRVPDRLCFWGILSPLVTGASWVDVEAILEHRVSDTTLWARRDEWIAAGVFDSRSAKRAPRTTGSSDATSARSRSMGRSTTLPDLL